MEQSILQKSNGNIFDFKDPKVPFYSNDGGDFLTRSRSCSTKM
jgi:hypothetical protein